MKRITMLFLAFCCMIVAMADVKHYAWEGKLGQNIKFKLELQENSLGVAAGQTTYYRSNGSVSVIPVFGWRIEYDGGETAFSLNEYENNKICGEFLLQMKGKKLESGTWSLLEKSYEMNEVKAIEPNYSLRFFHPARTIAAAAGEYSFTFDKGTGDECGGHCTLKASNGKLKWEMAQVTPNIAEGSGTSSFSESAFSGKVGKFSFKAYVDEKFVYVKRTNPSAGANDDWGAWATLEGIYVRKGAVKATSTAAKTETANTINDLQNWKTATYFTDDDRQDLTHDFYGDALNYLTSHWNTDNEAQYQNAKKLIAAKPLPVKANELTAYRRVRSIQFSEYNMDTYPYFKCKFTWEVNNLFFNKTAGSQRRWGELFRQNDYYINLTGCWYAGDDKPTYYTDETRLTVGQLKKVSKDKVVMLFRTRGGWELYEFAK